MTLLAVLRHGPTAWNRDGRLQGRADIQITDEARRALSQRRVPSPFCEWPVRCSPLIRCRQTAAALGLETVDEPRLIEMDWGDYQGRTIEALRRAEGAAFRANERRGLDFKPPHGESPRDVQQRLAPLLRELGAAGRSTLAVTHRGVIRALYAQAAGWDMTGDAAHRLEFYDTLQVFRLEADGTPRIEMLNLPLERS